MAPALTSNSFRVTAAAHFTPNTRPPKPPSTIVYAKQNAKESESVGNGKVPFKFDFGRLPDPKTFDFGKLPDPKTLIPAVRAPSGGTVFGRRKEAKTVFVAGATGQVGIRIAQTLLREGFAVRAGVPDLAAAQELARLAAAYKIISPEESKRLNAVESTFTDPESIAKAIGPATKLVVTISSSENGPANAVTTDDALDVIRAAQLAGVGHVAIIYDAISSGPGTSTNNVLDGITSFFNNFFAKQQMLTVGEFLEKLVDTDLSYTLIKTTLADDYAVEGSVYPLVLSKEGTTAEEESKVSKSQIARLVADVFSNTAVAENKVVEVSTSSSASSKPIAELFSAIPEDGRRKAYAEAAAKAKAAEDAVTASKKAREASVAAERLEEEVKKLSEQKALAANFSQEAQDRAKAAGASLESLLKRATKNIGGGGDLSWEKLSSQITSAVSQKGDDEPRAQVATIRGQAKAFNLTPRKAVVKKPTTKPNSKQMEQKPEVKKVFGGLFKQETIYMDED